MLVATMATLLFGADALASRVTFPGASPGLVETEMGTFPESTIRAFCDWITREDWSA